MKKPTAAETNSHRLCLLLVPGDDHAVVGLSTRERNRRVGERLGAIIVEDSALTGCDADQPLLVLPDGLTIDKALLKELDSLKPEGVFRLVTPRYREGLYFGTVGDWLVPPEGGRRVAETTRLVDSRWILPARTPREARVSSWVLLGASGKPTDGWVSRHLNRKISRPISFLFLSFRLRAWHASLVNLIIGLGSAVCIALTGYWTLVMAGALFQLASAFDGVDGEMARATLTESPRGAWIDTSIDNVTYLACLVGLAIGWGREGFGAVGLALACALVLGTVGLLFILFRFVREHAPDGSFVWVDRSIARAAETSGTLLLRLVRLLFLGLRRDFFAALFFLVSFAGRRSAIVLFAVLGFCVALFSFALFWRKIVQAAVELREEAA